MKAPEREWLNRLAPGSDGRETAIRQLRLFLVRGVRSGLHGRPRADDAFVEDVVQTALVRILDHLDTFEGRSAFTTWCLSIALRVAFGELRRKHWNNVSLDELKETAGLADARQDESPGPLEVTAFSSLMAVVHRLIRTKLTDRQRDVLLAELNAMPQDEIAREMGVTRNAIYKLSHDARKALRRELEASGYRVEHVRDVLETPMR